MQFHAGGGGVISVQNKKESRPTNRAIGRGTIYRAPTIAAQIGVCHNPRICSPKESWGIRDGERHKRKVLERQRNPRNLPALL